MFADLHIHTIYSDGIYNVDEIVDKSIELGLKIISITDHDTLKGSVMASMLKKKKIRIVTGIELTITNVVHVLGYGMNLNNKAFSHALNNINVLRAKWVFELVKKMQNQYDISIKKLLNLYGEVSLGGIINYLCSLKENGKTKAEWYDFFFNEQLYNKSKVPCFTLKEAIDFIHQSNGLAFLAHPSLIKQTYEKEEDRKYIKNFLDNAVKLGLDGIEVFHISNEKNNYIEFLLDYVESNNLLISGGSDFHGTKGKNAMLAKYGICKVYWNKINSRLKGGV